MLRAGCDLGSLGLFLQKREKQHPWAGRVLRRWGCSSVSPLSGPHYSSQTHLGPFLATFPGQVCCPKQIKYRLITNSFGMQNQD